MGAQLRDSMYMELVGGSVVVLGVANPDATKIFVGVQRNKKSVHEGRNIGVFERLVVCRHEQDLVVVSRFTTRHDRWPASSLLRTGGIQRAGCLALVGWGRRSFRALRVRPDERIDCPGNVVRGG